MREAFGRNFTERDELGAAVTVLLDGAPVADLRGGWADEARTRPWERETLVNVWSTTKGPTALCAHILADRGLLDLQAPVARYWPGRARSPPSYATSCRTVPAWPVSGSRTAWPSCTTGS